MGKFGDILSGAAGSAGTAAGGAAGSAIASGIIGVVNNIFGGGPSRWDNAGPGVHDWFTKYGPQAFLDWMAANAPDKFGSLDQVKALYAVWVWNTSRSLIGPSQSNFFVPITTPQAYAAIGINYQATVDNAMAKGLSLSNMSPANVIMLNGQGTPQVPKPAVQFLQNSRDKQVSGKPLTRDEKGAVDALNKAAGGGTFGSVGVWFLLLLLLFAVLRK